MRMGLTQHEETWRNRPLKNIFTSLLKGTPTQSTGLVASPLSSYYLVRLPLLRKASSPV